MTNSGTCLNNDVMENSLKNKNSRDDCQLGTDYRVTVPVCNFMAIFSYQYVYMKWHMLFKR